MVGSGVVLQKWVLEARPVNTSDLGPPKNRFVPDESVVPAAPHSLRFCFRRRTDSRSRFGMDSNRAE